MTEEFLYYIWQNRLFNRPLSTTEGLPVEVLFAGERNRDSGPDFLYARIRIDKTEWAGNVEIHLKTSDWFKHRHHFDKAYENVILHVVYEDDGENEKLSMPVLEIKDFFDHHVYENYLWLMNSGHTIPCQPLLERLATLDHFLWLDRLMTDRLMERTKIIITELKDKGVGLNEIFYRKLARSFGFKVNGEPFELLASSLPLTLIQKYADSLFQLEALLFGNSGLLTGTLKDEYLRQLKQEYTFLKQKHHLKTLDPSLWKFMRMRPVNFPTIRIAQFSALIHSLGGQVSKLTEVEKLASLKGLLKVKASSYWNDHYRMQVFSKGKEKVLGEASVNLLLINAVIPFIFIYGKLYGKNDLVDRALAWLEQLPPEKNRITEMYHKLGFPLINAMNSQALLYLKKYYCDNKNCLRCALGNKLLRAVGNN